MTMLIGAVWAAVGAAVVAWLLAKQQDADQHVDCSRVLEPGSAFVLCTAFLLAAPIVLARARGNRGALEGLGILVGCWALSVASSIALVGAS
jgi:drug/metabolite transporter (DMT)-like permease